MNNVARREPLRLRSLHVAARGIAVGEMVLEFNDRGACVAGARFDEGLRCGDVVLATGAWSDLTSHGDPSSIDRPGNPTTLARGIGAPSMTQGCAAPTCFVEGARLEGKPPEVRPFELAESVRG